MINILEELQELWLLTDKEKLELVAEQIAINNKSLVVGLGAGRMGYSMQAFVMRLSHLGFKSFMIGDTSLPRIDSKSLVLINSSSGETPSILLYAQQARDENSNIITFTAEANSTIANLSNLIMPIPKIATNQIMKTIYEQYTYLLFDYLAALILDKSGLDKGWVINNHSILE